MLPSPDKFGAITLECGSIIYPSACSFTRNDGSLFKAPNHGKYMLWIKSGEEEVEGRLVAKGDFVMTPAGTSPEEAGPVYFDSPAAALYYLNQSREKVAA